MRLYTIITFTIALWLLMGTQVVSADEYTATGVNSITGESVYAQVAAGGNSTYVDTMLWDRMMLIYTTCEWIDPHKSLECVVGDTSFYLEVVDE